MQSITITTLIPKEKGSYQDRMSGSIFLIGDFLTPSTRLEFWHLEVDSVHQLALWQSPVGPAASNDP